jgi:hypothetical protein
VHSDLMGPAGLEADPNQSELLETLLHPPVSDCLAPDTSPCAEALSVLRMPPNRRIDPLSCSESRR